MWRCVRIEIRNQYAGSSVSADLYRLADWLNSCGVTTVAMQSTGVYWIPLYDILEERGFEVYLVNARHTKNLPGRKSDVQECQWLLKLHTYGLLNNSFRPTSQIRGATDVLAATPQQKANQADLYQCCQNPGAKEYQQSYPPCSQNTLPVKNCR
jgi:Transposase